MSIKDKLKAEIERLKAENNCGTDDFIEAKRIAFDMVLKTLATLEEEPVEIDFEQELYNHFGQVKDFTLGMSIGQYFYNLGRQSKPNPERKLRKVSTWVSDTEKELKEKSEKPTTAEGLEEEIYNYANTIAEGTPLFEIIPQTARHFAQWGAEHLKK